jgi:hypothetical protein
MIHIVCIELELKHISQRVSLAIKAFLPSDLEHFGSFGSLFEGFWSPLGGLGSHLEAKTRPGPF